MIKTHRKKRTVVSRTRSNDLDDSASTEHGCGFGGHTFKGSCYQAIKFDITNSNGMVQYREKFKKTPQQKSLSL